MIDTDKYTGHTEGPWCYYHSNQFIETEEGIHLFTNFGDTDDPAYDVNSELVADAPLLLEEVKRLRKRQETMMHWLLKTKDSEWEDKEYVLTRIDEGYDLDTVIEIYEARVDMYACSIEADILDTLKELIE